MPNAESLSMPRRRYAARWAIRHLFASLLVALMAAWVVFGMWYPAPWHEMLGVGGVFTIVILADVVCGPLLTLVLASPRKSFRERVVDLTLVASIQLLALVFGLWSVHSARPVVLAFEVDRFVVVTANEVQMESLPDAPDFARRLPFAGPMMVSVRRPLNSDELVSSLDMSLQGVMQFMRPNWWAPYENSRSEVDARAKPMQHLLDRRADQRSILLEAAKQTGQPIDQLRYLPLTSSKVDDWTALIDMQGRMVGHAKVDAFE
jgi:hypothetical protein